MHYTHTHTRAIFVFRLAKTTTTPVVQPTSESEREQPASLPCCCNCAAFSHAVWAVGGGKERQSERERERWWGGEGQAGVATFIRSWVAAVFSACFFSCLPLVLCPLMAKFLPLQLICGRKGGEEEGGRGRRL